jgi:hypothetical protein
VCAVRLRPVLHWLSRSADPPSPRGLVVFLRLTTNQRGNCRPRRSIRRNRLKRTVKHIRQPVAIDARRLWRCLLGSSPIGQPGQHTGRVSSKLGNKFLRTCMGSARRYRESPLKNNVEPPTKLPGKASCRRTLKPR